jgi:hypothetical protein
MLITATVVLIPTLLGVIQHQGVVITPAPLVIPFWNVPLWRYLGFVLVMYCGYIFWASLEANHNSMVTMFEGVPVLLSRVGGKPFVVKELTIPEFYAHMNYAVRAFSAVALGISDVCLVYLIDHKEAWSNPSTVVADLSSG